MSADLGLSTIGVTVEEDGVRFPGGEMLGWDSIDEISASANNCYMVEDGEARKILAFSELTGRVYSLMPTRRAPTMLVSGIPMHRIKDTDPYQDTREKIKTIRPVTGQVLDTATGLGYTAVEAAKSADGVTTIELDPTVLEIARQNPWSRQLFSRRNIVQRVGDSFGVVADLPDASFNHIIHDPPAFSVAGQLFSGEFYSHLHRVLKRGGRLFHYIGNPDTRSGRNVTRGVIARLGEAGFRRIQRRPQAFGVVAVK
jgi:predicted methyltransferase